MSQKGLLYGKMRRSVVPTLASTVITYMQWHRLSIPHIMEHIKYNSPHRSHIVRPTFSVCSYGPAQILSTWSGPGYPIGYATHMGQPETCMPTCSYPGLPHMATTSGSSHIAHLRYHRLLCQLKPCPQAMVLVCP